MLALKGCTGESHRLVRWICPSHVWDTVAPGGHPGLQPLASRSHAQGSLPSKTGYQRQPRSRSASHYRSSPQRRCPCWPPDRRRQFCRHSQGVQRAWPANRFGTRLSRPLGMVQFGLLQADIELIVDPFSGPFLCWNGTVPRTSTEAWRSRRERSERRRMPVQTPKPCRREGAGS